MGYSLELSSGPSENYNHKTLALSLRFSYRRPGVSVRGSRFSPLYFPLFRSYGFTLCG